MAHIHDTKRDEFEALPIYRRPKQDKESDQTVKGNKTKSVESTARDRESVIQFSFCPQTSLTKECDGYTHKELVATATKYACD